MGKSLVIVESPAKAKTINKYLGKEYVVKSSIGHIRDLPTSGSTAPARSRPSAARPLRPQDAERMIAQGERPSAQLFARMGIDPEHGWKAQLRDPARQGKGGRRAAQAGQGRRHHLSRDRLGSRGGGDRLAPARGDRRRRQPLPARGVQRDHQEGHPGGVRPARRARHQPRQCAAGAALPRPRGRLHGVAAAVGEDRARPVRRPRAVGGGAPGGRARARDSRLRPGGILGSACRPGARRSRPRCASRWHARTARPSARLNEAEAMAALAKLKAASYSVAKREDKPTRSKPSAHRSSPRPCSRRRARASASA